jgi:GR25 family glycosyltransferase involved in LPS biosynthesis
MSENSICLNMIVKNESHVIIKTLTNLFSYINFSYWVICDTGSTDNTKQLIYDFFNEKGIKGELYDHEWKDFGHNRSLALECAYNKTDLLFIFDADDEIVGNLVLPNTFDCDRYTFTFGSGFVYVRPLLINNRKKWGFKGVLHEFLIDLEPVNCTKHFEGDYYINSGRTGNRSKNPNKYIDDATILKKAHYDVLESDYNLSCRYAFYCAQSFKDCGEKYINDAIEWYQKCLTLKMWNQEQYVSCLTIGDLYSRQNDMPNALKYWYKTVEFDSERLEGIINAMNYLRNDGQNLLVNALYHKFKNYNKKPKGKLFTFDSVYEDQLEYNNTISAFYVNDKISGYECSKQIFVNNKLPYNLMKLSISNFKFYSDLFNKDTDANKLQLFYSFDDLIHNIASKNELIEENMINLWNKLFEACRLLLTKPSTLNFTLKKQKQHIFISFTTCKRLDLFKETVYSMLNHWNDIDKIDYWFCVDDNSSDEDRKQMKTLFPWINFYMKPEEEKGHRNSMNIIYNKLKKIKPTYWIHMEDDFLFHKKLYYIYDSISALNNQHCIDNNVKQILFNRNYGEIVENYNSKGHIINEYNSDIVLHKHCNGQFNYTNCHYWPHYSFRPSLIDVKTILELGNFDSDNKFFELDYAKKWTKSGYTSAFFNRITCRHIGRLTSDRNTKAVKNAYDLNNEEQFFEKTKKKSKNKIKIVNLERREDRKKETIRKFIEADIKTDDYEFIKAVDGKLLEPNSRLKHLFHNNDFGSRRGVIGCALSHFNLWFQLLNDSDNEYYIIMEDDFTLSKKFKQQFEMLQTNNEFSKRDVLFLGYSMFQKNRQTYFQRYNSESDTINIEPLDRKLYIGGYFAYSINKNGAKNLIDYIEKNGIKHGIDYLNKFMPNLDSYECQPQIVFSEWNENGKQIDSDIQNIYESINFKNIVDELEQIKEKYVFISKLDQYGNDIYYHKQSLEDNFLISENDPNCIGFNTLGFFKNKIDIDDLKPSKYFNEEDGIYIKKSFYKDHLNKKQIEIKAIDKHFIRIKMLCNWTSSQQLCKEWSNMCENGFKWKNYELVWTDVKEDIDYYVIINYPPKGAYFDPKRTIVFQMEPWVNDLNKNWGVKTWGKWAEPDPNNFLSVRGHKTNHHNNAFWQLELKLNDFQKSELFEKTKGTIVSSICSSKYFDEGHIARIDFLKFLETKGDLQLDIYNKDNNPQFKNYRGVVSPYIDKSKGLAPYKYYFMIENNYETNFITEKLWEPILCETLVFYYGCPNVTDYVDSRAFVQLDITDFEKSYQIIKQSLNEDLWSQRIDIIRQEKQRILNELSFFPTIDKIINL